jgi:hypothetical protein
MSKTLEVLDRQTTTNQTIIVIGSAVDDNKTTGNELNLNAEITRETISVYLHWKFPDREHNRNKKLVSLLLSDLQTVGFKNYNQIEKIVNDNLNWFNSFEKSNPHSNSVNHRFSDIGAIRIILTEKFVP